MRVKHERKFVNELYVCHALIYSLVQTDTIQILFLRETNVFIRLGIALSLVFILCPKLIYPETDYIRPTVGAWGVSIINFQLESTALADEKYAAEYEASSLQLAKANANLRALTAQNTVSIMENTTNSNRLFF